MDLPVAVQKRKENFKSHQYFNPLAHLGVFYLLCHIIIFDSLMQGHEVLYFLKLVTFMYSSNLCHVSLFLLVTQEPHSNPLSQSWLFCVYEHQMFLAYCLRMKGLKVTFNTVSRSHCTLCHNHFMKLALYFAHGLAGQLCSKAWLASKNRRITNNVGKSKTECQEQINYSDAR